MLPRKVALSEDNKPSSLSLAIKIVPSVLNDSKELSLAMTALDHQLCLCATSTDQLTPR